MASGGSRPLDPIKRMIAQSVQHHLVSGPERPALPEKPDNVESVEGQIVKPTETMMRVVTSNQGVRYFHVTVREMM